MRIARSTLILFVANLIVFGLVWRASITHTIAPVSQNLLFPTGITGLEITDNGTKITLEKKGSSNASSMNYVLSIVKKVLALTK